MCGGVKLAKNTDLDKYIYTGYGIGFDFCSEFSLPDGGMGKNICIFGGDMSSSVHIDNKEKYSLILSIGPAQGLDDTMLAAEAQLIQLIFQDQIDFLSLHYKGSNSFLFVNTTKTHQLKAKDSEINNYRLPLGNTSGDFSANKMKKITGLNT